MKKPLTIILVFLFIGCVPILREKVAPVEPCPEVFTEGVLIKIGKGDNSLKDTVSGLNDIYGDPTVEISAFRSDSGEIVIMKKLYYSINEGAFMVVSVVNGKVLMIDTVHAPPLEYKTRF